MAWYDLGTDSTKKFRLGTVKKAVNGNKYIYLAGAASTAVGDFVVYDEGFATSRITTTVLPGAPLAVAIVANAATTTYAWYGVAGSFTGATNDSGGDADNKQAYASSTTGAACDTADNDAKLEGVIYRSNDSSTALTATFQLCEGAHFTHDLST